MNILGINSFFNHPAVALVRDGSLVFALEEERLTRIKNGRRASLYQTTIPFASIHAALRSQGMTVQDIDEVAFSYSANLHLRSLPGAAWRGLSLRKEAAACLTAARSSAALCDDSEVFQRWRDVLDPAAFSRATRRAWDHLKSHAASAFFLSGFEESLVLVSDMRGERAAAAVYVGKGERLHKVAEILLPHSLGLFAARLTQHLGFEPGGDEYKVMGMAAYGEDRYAKQMAEILTSYEGGFRVSPQALRSLGTLLGPARLCAEPPTQLHFDIAKSAQTHLEKTVVALASHYLRETGQRRLCVAGETFHNILVNTRLSQMEGVEALFVQPASHDAGTAIGAAALSWIGRGGKSSPQLRWKSLFLGTEYDDWQMEKALKQAGVSYTRPKSEAAAGELAKLLAEEKIVALFRGRMEFGPRALGHRSLLASPSSPRTRDKLNALKGRESFRPLAPLVTAEAFDAYFEGPRSNAMMFAVKVKESARASIPAIVHADGTARTQIVHREEDPFLHEVLTAFQKRGNPPILINTSLNVRGQPIDESPYDALSSTYTSGLDALVLGPFFIQTSTAR